MSQMDNHERIVLAGGCFWCTEAIFLNLRGVVSAQPGYAGGNVIDPTYEQVSLGRTGHAESVEIIYDPSEVALEDILTVFFATHDPTTLNRQGNDVGTQYRSAVFYVTESQKEATERFIKKTKDETGLAIVTEVVELEKFYPAEDYHQKYYAKNQGAPYCQLAIDPKLKKLRENFQALLKD